MGRGWCRKVVDSKKKQGSKVCRLVNDSNGALTGMEMTHTAAEKEGNA